MDAGTANWQGLPNSTMTSESGLGHSGSTSLYHLRWDSSGENGVRQDVTSAISSGVTYESGVWLHTYSTGGPYYAKTQLRISSSGDGEKIFAADPTSVASIGTWIYASGTVTPTWNGTLLSAYFEAVTNIQETYYDDAYLRLSQTNPQHVNVSLQVTGDTRARVQSATWLKNSPL